MHEDTKALQKYHESAQAMLVAAHGLFTDIIEKIKRQEYRDETLCDLGFLFREIANISEELRKEASAKQELAGMVLAQRVTTAHVNDPTIDPTVRGELATGMPRLKQEGSVPKYGTPEYVSFCRFLGLPEEAIRRGIFTLSYQRTAELLTELAEQGKNPPSGIAKTYNKFSTTFTRVRKGRDE